MGREAASAAGLNLDLQILHFDKASEQSLTSCAYPTTGEFAMVDELVKAHLNLYAVLQNMEELVAHDTATVEVARDWHITIQFSVRNGPAGFLEFKNGVCRFGKGQHASPSVRLFFTSPAHFNRMMDGKGNPIPLKGFTRIGFLTKEFPKATDRLEYFLTPTDELLTDPQYLALNTRMTLNTAAFAVVELARYDRIGRLNAAHIMNGGVLMKILPEGPDGIYLRHFHL